MNASDLIFRGLIFLFRFLSLSFTFSLSFSLSQETGDVNRANEKKREGVKYGQCKRCSSVSSREKPLGVAIDMMGFRSFGSRLPDFTFTSPCPISPREL